MKTIKKSLIALILLAILVIGAFFGIKMIKNRDQKNNLNKETSSTENETAKEEISQEETKEQRAKNIISQMTLGQKIGQMLIIRNDYTSMTPVYQAEIAEIQPGGYTIFDKNITTLSGTKQFIDDSRAEMEKASTIEMSDGSTEVVPAFMSVDQEGGLVQRLQSISDYPPDYIEPMGTIGASGSTDKAYQTGRILAEQCKSVGLNLDFAPVADIFSNPYNTVIGNRAFGTDKETVVTMSVALAKGLRESGVTPVYKHFPGHGDTLADSHRALPIVTKTLEELLENELYPFQEAIKNEAEMIMVAHIALPNITGDYTPASLSPKITTEILKNKLGFKGLVITDGLDMGALTQYYSNAQIAVDAVLAGADILLTPVSPLEAKNAILEAVKNGTIPESRIDESVQKILELKLKK